VEVAPQYAQHTTATTRVVAAFGRREPSADTAFG